MRKNTSRKIGGKNLSFILLCNVFSLLFGLLSYPLKKFSPIGFSGSPLFTEPDYNKKEVRKDNSPDRRSTIYWSGPVITDENGKASINFFTADPNTTYTVTIKGITASGDIFLKRFLINRN